MILPTFFYAAAVDGLAADSLYELTPFTFEGQNKFAMEKGVTSLPAVMHFAREGQEYLRYIAADHAPGPVPSATEPGHPTFLAIKRVFEEFNPDFCIVEGFDGKEGTDLRADPMYKSEGPGEPAYVVRLAKEKNILFAGGESTDIAMLDHLESKSFSRDDYACLCITQYIAENWRNHGDLWQNPNLKEYIDKKAGLYVEHFGKAYSFDDYQAWIRANYPRVLPFGELTDTKLTVPISDGAKLQQIAYASGLLRDAEILDRIIDATDIHERVLVVYGASHYYVQHKELEKRFGAPRYETFKL